MDNTSTITYVSGDKINSINVRQLSAYSSLPTLKNNQASVYDFYSPESITIRPMTKCRIPLDLQITLPSNTVLTFQTRPSQSKNNLMIINSTVDSTFKGNLEVFLFNFGPRPYRIMALDRICQGIIYDCKTPDLLVINQKVKEEIVQTNILPDSDDPHDHNASHDQDSTQPKETI